jgi:dipeptidyl-peptidase 4
MELMSLGPNELRAALFLPSWYSAGDGPLPVLLDPYAGPAAASRRGLSYAAAYAL